MIHSETHASVSYNEIIETMCGYAETHLQNGRKLNHITRHMIGLFQGMQGARSWRQTLSVKAVKPGAGPEVIEEAYSLVANKALVAA